MLRIAWRRRAHADLRNVFLWLLDRNPSAAWRTYHAVRDHIAILGEHPELGRPGRVERTRELVIPHTPYVVIYTVESGSEVIILRVLHAPSAARTTRLKQAISRPFSPRRLRRLM